jgi:simple sugar transport system permease protein
LTWLREYAIRLIFIIVPIVISVALTAGLIALLGNDPLNVYTTMWEGAFRNSSSLGKVFNFWIPLTLASAGLVVTFRAGLWNIGIEGQIVLGAVFASWGAQFLDLPAPLLISVSLLLAAIGGALWSVLAGVLKTRFGVHEIFGGVALNAIANNLAIYLIAGPWQPPEGGSAQSTPTFPEASWLPTYSSDFDVSILMLVITGLSLVVVWLMLEYTRWGLELKATGSNARSALLLGVRTEQVSLLAFALCGALAGLAGAHRVLHTYHALRPLVAGGIGFLGLLVVLLAGFSAIIVPFVSFAFAAMFGGSDRLKILLRLDQSLVGVLQGTVVLIILYFNGLRQRLTGQGGDSNTTLTGENR